MYSFYAWSDRFVGFTTLINLSDTPVDMNLVQCVVLVLALLGLFSATDAQTRKDLQAYLSSVYTAVGTADWAKLSDARALFSSAVRFICRIYHSLVSTV